MKRKIANHLWHGVVFVIVCAAVIGIVMVLWNALIPSIIGWSTINYWQAAGLMILCKFMFGGLGHHGHRLHRRYHHRKHAQLHNKLNNMSRDERREFIRKKMAMGFKDFDETDTCNCNDKKNEASERNEG